MKKSVELNVYLYQNEETIIETFPAKDWGDFLVVGIDIQGGIDDAAYQKISQTFKQFTDETGKTIIVVPSSWRIDFYGIEEHEDEQSKTESPADS